MDMISPDPSPPERAAPDPGAREPLDAARRFVIPIPG
jgi:hypothetical protein